MATYLCLSVTLLDNLYHGRRDDDEPEWPPSPMRLFEALVAGSKRAGNWTQEKEAAFCWLESNQHPIIVAPAAQETPGFTLFVPNNDADQRIERNERLTSKPVRPSRVLPYPDEKVEFPRIHYLWPISANSAKETSDYCKILCSEARHLTALGWGIDQAVACGQVIDDLNDPSLVGYRWYPRDNAKGHGAMLRVPKPGSLQDCQNVYQSFMERVKLTKSRRKAQLRYFTPSKLRCFDSVPYLRSLVLPRPYAAFEFPEGIAFRQEIACLVAAMVRSLVCRERQDFAEQFPEDDSECFLAGHIEGAATFPRFSYLPLPSIGHKHSDAMIRRVLIAEPFGGDGQRAAWVENRCRNRVLTDDQGNERGTLFHLRGAASRRMVARYTKESTSWATVTPVILPGFDVSHCGKRVLMRPSVSRKRDRLFLKAVQQAGLPVELVESFVLRKAPFWPGSVHPARYARPAYLDRGQQKRFPAWHVYLRFREPVPGPIAIGAGRHFGLGLFAACEQM